MNFKQAALFLYGVSMLEDRIHNGSKIDQTLYVWSYGSGLLTANFYEASSLFNKSVDKYQYRKAFIAEFLENADFGDQSGELYKNQALFLSKLKEFVLGLSEDEFDLNVSVTNIHFLGKNLPNFDFYLFPDDFEINPVSILPSET